MAYTKTVWNEGGSPGISADNLNHIEQGIADAHTALAEWESSYVSLTATENQTLAGPITVPGISVTGDVSEVTNVTASGTISATTDVKVKGNSAWHRGNLTIANTAPTSPQVDDVWIDTSVTLT